MSKTLGNVNLKEKIYRVIIRNSKIIENSDGSIVKTLTIESIEPVGDFYNFNLRLSDGSTIRVYRNSEVTTIERTPDERFEHPMAIFQDFYSQDRKKLLENVVARLSDNAERMNELKKEVLKISNTCIISLNIAKSMMSLYTDEKEMTEEEFASIAL
jgi:hypothetical protein